MQIVSKIIQVFKSSVFYQASITHNLQNKFYLYLFNKCYFPNQQQTNEVGCHCDSVSQYARQCSLQTDLDANWRTRGFCGKQ